MSSCYSLNSAFRCLHLSFFPLLFASLLFTAICKAASDSHFVFLHFFSLFSESLIQFSVEGQGCVSSLLSDLRANYGGCNEDKGDLLPKSYACTATLRAPTLQQATADPRLHCRLLDTPGQDWVSLLWGHCSFLLGPGVHKLLFVPSKSLFPQSCVSSGGSMVRLMTTSSKRTSFIIPTTVGRNP